MEAGRLLDGVLETIDILADPKDIRGMRRALKGVRAGKVSGWDREDRVVIDPKILLGKPVIKGTRIAVEFIIDLLATGWTVEAILKDYSQLSKEDIEAALKYAAKALKQEKVYPLP